MSFGLLFAMAMEALIAGVSVGLYLFCIRPQLQWRRAKPAAFVISALLGASVPTALALGAVFPIPPSVATFPTLLLVVIWFWPDFVMRVTGGDRPLDASTTVLLSVLTEAGKQLEVGDVDGFADGVQEARSRATATTAPYVELWERFVEEERGRRAGVLQSSAPTAEALRAEYARIRGAGAALPAPFAVLTVVVAAVVAVLPTGLALATGTDLSPVCRAAKHGASPGAPGAAARSGPLADLLLRLPGPDFTLVGEGSMNIEEAASSRVDTDTLQQLRDAQFQGAYARDWIRADGTRLGNDVFSFATNAGAARYHRAVTAYACGYSTEAFEVPGGGVGLRIRYGSGDPVRDQVAWVDANRRFVVAIGYQDPPADHVEALALAAAVRAASSEGEP